MKGAVLIYEGRIKNIIKTLFNGIDIKDYFFNLSYWESYEYSNANYDFNAEENVSSDIFKNELFKEELEIYPEFLEARLRKPWRFRKIVGSFRLRFEMRWRCAVLYR